LPPDENIRQREKDTAAPDARPETRPSRPRAEPRRRVLLKPHFDLLLIAAGVLAFLSLYLPWLPAIYGTVPGWMVPYSTADLMLDEIRHLEDVRRPESLFILSFVGAAALLFSRTSRFAGLRDLAASILLTVGGGYVLVYFAGEWGWCLLYHHVGPYAAFTALALVVAAGLRRINYMPRTPAARLFLLLAGAFLATGFFLPWSLDHTGLGLMFVARKFYWMASLRAYAVLMPIFPLLGAGAFAAAFGEPPWLPAFLKRSWALWLAVGALVYFRVMWAPYLSGFPLGSWGTLFGLLLLGSAGILKALPGHPRVARFLVWAFLAVNAVVWARYLVQGGLLETLGEFFRVPPPFIL